MKVGLQYMDCKRKSREERRMNAEKNLRVKKGTKMYETIKHNKRKGRKINTG